MPEIVRQVVRVDGLDVLLRRSGAGPAVVVCGPLSRAGTDVEDVRRSLSAGRTSVSVDPPGRGLSDALDAPPTVVGAARHLASALGAAGIDPDVVVGARGGAGLAAELAVELGSRRLVLCDPVLPDAATRRRWRHEIAPDVSPRLDASHLLRHWAMRRDDELFRPWFDTTHRLAGDLDDPVVLHRVHDAVVDQLSAGPSWQAAFWAELDHDGAAAVRAAASRLDVVVAEAVDAVARLATVRPDSPEPPAVVAVPDPQPTRGWSRHLVPTEWGHVLVRRRPADEPTGARPLVLLHSSPGSGESLLPLAEALGSGRTVLVPDTLGNGDSDVPRAPDVTIELLARAALAAVTRCEPGELDVHGAHTGAAIAVEMALAEPARIRHVVLDGIGLFTPAEVGDALAHHFVDVTPRWDGTHLVAAWAQLLDGRRYFPWHHRTSAHRRSAPEPDATVLARAHTQMMRSGTSYPLSYRAAFVHPTRERLARLTVTTAVVRRPHDVLDAHAEAAASLVPGSVQLVLGHGDVSDAAAVAAFLDG